MPNLRPVFAITPFAIGRLSTTASGAEANGSSDVEALSPAGTKVAFFSNSTDLLPGDTSNAYDAFVKDLTTGELTRVSVSAAGVYGTDRRRASPVRFLRAERGWCSAISRPISSECHPHDAYRPNCPTTGGFPMAEK